MTGKAAWQLRASCLEGEPTLARVPGRACKLVHAVPLEGA